MKKVFKKIPAFVVVSLIIVLTVILTALAAALSYDLDGDGNVTENDVKILMEAITGIDVDSDVSMTDYNGDNKINVLDVIALKRKQLNGDTYPDGWTVGIY